MTEPLSGGCLCGAVRYQPATHVLFALHCCCRQCQRLTGADVTNAFCPRCGSPIFRRTERFSNTTFFHAGSLDDPSPFRPEQSVWTSGRQPWDLLDSALPAG